MSTRWCPLRRWNEATYRYWTRPERTKRFVKLPDDEAMELGILRFAKGLTRPGVYIRYYDPRRVKRARRRFKIMYPRGRHKIRGLSFSHVIIDDPHNHAVDAVSYAFKGAATDCKTATEKHLEDMAELFKACALGAPPRLVAPELRE